MKLRYIIFKEGGEKVDKKTKDKIRACNTINMVSRICKEAQKENNKEAHILKVYNLSSEYLRLKEKV